MIHSHFSDVVVNLVDIKSKTNMSKAQSSFQQLSNIESHNKKDEGHTKNYCDFKEDKKFKIHFK